MANLFNDVQSARQLVISQNSKIDIIENPNTGKVFFVCGNIQGYVSKAALKAKSLDELDFGVHAELGIPTLFVHHEPSNVLKSFALSHK